MSALTIKVHTWRFVGSLYPGSCDSSAVTYISAKKHTTQIESVVRVTGLPSAQYIVNVKLLIHKGKKEM